MMFSEFARVEAGYRSIVAIIQKYVFCTNRFGGASPTERRAANFTWRLYKTLSFVSTWAAFNGRSPPA